MDEENEITTDSKEALDKALEMASLRYQEILSSDDKLDRKSQYSIKIITFIVGVLSFLGISSADDIGISNFNVVLKVIAIILFNFEVLAFIIILFLDVSVKKTEKRYSFFPGSELFKSHLTKNDDIAFRKFLLDSYLKAIDCNSELNCKKGTLLRWMDWALFAFLLVIVIMLFLCFFNKYMLI